MPDRTNRGGTDGIPVSCGKVWRFWTAGRKNLDPPAQTGPFPTSGTVVKERLTQASRFGKDLVIDSINNGRSHERCTPIETLIARNQAVGVLCFGGPAGSKSKAGEAVAVTISGSKVALGGMADARKHHWRINVILKNSDAKIHVSNRGFKEVKTFE